MNKRFLCGLALLLLGGCTSFVKTDPRDPLEPINRVVYSFNRSIDKAVLRPVARGYKAITPAPVATGVSNIFANFDDILTAFNDVLQGKFLQSGSDTLRLVVNSTVGLAGIFDVASHWGLKKHDEDFGQTLGYWGIKPGPYLMLPFLGPSSFRGAWGELGDYPFHPLRYVKNVAFRNSMKGLKYVDKRAQLLEFDSQLDEALDEYAFIRDAYLQHRKFKVYDGNPPITAEDWLGSEDDCDTEDDSCN